MKKIAIVLLLIVFSSMPAGATSFIFDVDHDGDLTDAEAILVSQFQADAISNFDVVVDLGDDGIFNGGDTFTDSYTLKIHNSEDSNGSDNYNFLVEGISFTAEISGITGEVTNFDNGGTDTTADSINIADDTWDLEFYQGDIGTGAGVATLTIDGFDIGTFLVVSGGTDSPFTANTNDTVTGSTGVVLVALELAADYWYTTDGTDMSTLDPQSLVIGMVDSGANLVGVSGDDNGTGTVTDDKITLTLADNGDTIRISVVPEPATFALFGLGLLGVAAISRRKSA